MPSYSGVWTLQQQMQAIAASAWPFPIPPDPYFNQTTLLLHGNGTNGAQNNTFLDSSTNNFAITRNGNTTQGTFSPYGSNWGNYFDGSGDNLSLTGITAVGNSNATVEFFIFPTDSSLTYRSVFDSRSTVGTDTGFGIFQYGLTIEVYGNGLKVSSAASALTINQWNHVAITRSSGTCQLYINGSTSGSNGTYSNNLTSTIASIGDSAQTSNPYVGYISNLRVVVGSVVYSGSTYTVPTAPLTAITNTSLLTCQSNRFIDNSTNNFAITRNGDVSVQRFSPFAPSAAYSASTIGGSGYFDGTGDYLSIADNAAFDFGSGDFTIEAWVYANSLGSFNAVVSQWPDNGGTTNNSFVLESVGSNMEFYWASGSILYGPATLGTISTGTWTHYAICRSGNTLYPFRNGVLGTTVSITQTLHNPTSAVTIGGQVAGSGFWNGYISNLRIVKGTAVYTANFTPPTAPVTNITNTSLLTNFTNAGILDNAMMNDLETVGNAQISTAQSKFGGGSMYFDGTGDYLVTSPSPSNTLDSGDFTVEFWAYPSNTSSAYRALVSSENYDAVSGGWSIYQNGTSIEVWLSSGQLINATSALTASTWQHVALSRSSGTVRLFVNGTSISSASNSASWTGQRIWIGDNNRAGPDYFYDGYIDDLRITKGVARYTANFTPPTLEFQNL